MRKQILAGATVFVFAAGLTTSAMAFDHKVGKHGHAGRVHAGAGRNYDVRYNQGGFISLGPLGFTAACGSYPPQRGYCGQGYSISAWTY